jgi:hypothetical protein
MKTALKHADRMLNEHEVADILNIKVSTLRSWRVKGSPLEFCSIGRSIRYEPAAVEAFIAANRMTSTSARSV